MPPKYKPITDYLTEDGLKKLREAFIAGPPPALSTPLLTVYGSSKAFVDSLVDFAKSCVPDTTPPPRDTLSIQDRERCIIALLCSRREDIELSIHIYLALMTGVSILEIANIMLLASMYTGVDNLTRGLLVYTTTLETLSCQANPEPQKVVDALTDTFDRYVPACGT